MTEVTSKKFFECAKCKKGVAEIQFIDRAEKKRAFMATQIGVCDECYTKRPTYTTKRTDWANGGKEVIEEHTIKVGMGITRHVGTDCYPYHVSRVSDSGKTIYAKNAGASPAPGHDPFGTQKYIISRDAVAPEESLRKRKNGHWYDSGGMDYSFSGARYYQDPHL